MHAINYTLFEILKYKIEFLECLEYSITSIEINKRDIEEKINYLYSDFKEGLYKDITSSLFTSFNSLNDSIIKFFKNYKINKIKKINSTNKLKDLLNYNETMIDCYETFNYIISSIIEEKEISKHLNKKIEELINLSNKYFTSFLFFNSYNLYLNSLYTNQKNLRFTEKEINKLISIINYCNKNNAFTNYIDTLKNNNKDMIYKDFEKISNNCIELEKKQNNLLNELINIINEEIKQK